MFSIFNFRVRCDLGTLLLRKLKSVFNFILFFLFFYPLIFLLTGQINLNRFLFLCLIKKMHCFSFPFYLASEMHAFVCFVVGCAVASCFILSFLSFSKPVSLPRAPLVFPLSVWFVVLSACFSLRRLASLSPNSNMAGVAWLSLSQTYETDELSEEMAHLEGLMKDLNAITTG